MSFSPQEFQMKRLQPSLASVAFAAMLFAAAAAAQVPASPKIAVQAITQVAPNLPQYTKVDQPMLRDGMARATNGRVEITLSSWPERNVNGPEVLRLVRSARSTSPQRR
jgi:TRAP-type transport system periplasmic protein